jgi:hypothetical protein
MNWGDIKSFLKLHEQTSDFLSRISGIWGLLDKGFFCDLQYCD